MIRGLGGIFIYAQDAQKLVAWYSKHFGMNFQFEAEEQSFYIDFVLPVDPAFGRIEREVFAIRQSDDLAPLARRRIVINLRVHDLSRLLEALKNAGVDDTRAQDYEYGRFAWLNDPEGNELELFEAT